MPFEESLKTFNGIFTGQPNSLAAVEYLRKKPLPLFMYWLARARARAIDTSNIVGDKQ